MPPAQTTAQLGLFTEEGSSSVTSCINHLLRMHIVLFSVLPEGRGALKKDVEALVIELDKIKQELK